MAGRVLIVDDEPDQTELVQIALEGTGIECIRIHQPDTAFDAVKQHNPDVVILDIMMPGTNGLDLCRAIRKDRDTYRIPVMFLTVWEDDPEVLHGLNQGADSYLAKPFKPPVLVSHVREMIQLGQSIERLNPVSSMPSHEAIKRELLHRLLHDNSFAVCGMQISSFHPFRKEYGRTDAERMIRWLAETIQSVIEEKSLENPFAGHIGGEHFVAIVPGEEVRDFAEALSQSFDQGSSRFYRQLDRQRGYILSKSKEGARRNFPLPALSMGIVHCEPGAFRNISEIFHLIDQLCAQASLSEGEQIFSDRRGTTSPCFPEDPEVVEDNND